MFTLLCVVAILIAVLLVLSVIVQNSKGGGLNNAFGASSISSMIGNRKASQDIERITWYLGALLMVVSFVATVFMSNSPATSKSKMAEALAKTQRGANVAPAANTSAPAEK